MNFRYAALLPVLIDTWLAGCIDTSIYKPALKWPNVSQSPPDQQEAPASHQALNPVTPHSDNAVAQRSAIRAPSFLGSCDYQFNTRELLRLRPPRITDRVISDRDSWSSGSGMAFGKAQLSAQPWSNGSLYLWFNLEASSNKFKLYSNTQAYAVFANSKGDIILFDTEYQRQTYPFRISGLEMSMTGRRNTKESEAVIKLSPGCDVAYMMIKFRFCGFQESFSRSNIGSNCSRGEFSFINNRQAVGLKLNDVEYIEQLLKSRQLAVGEQMSTREAPMPVRGSTRTIQHSGRWTVMRIK